MTPTVQHRAGIWFGEVPVVIIVVHVRTGKGSGDSSKKIGIDEA